MANPLRKVTLLGAFEIQTEDETPQRDGLILGSRREQKGFVLETSRENLEQILALAAPERDGLPQRLAHGIGKTLQDLGFVLKRIELVPLPTPAPTEGEEEGYGSFVQGWLVFSDGPRRLHRLPMTASEAIQVSLATDVVMMAHVDLLQLNVGQFIAHVDEVNAQQSRETKQFRKFVDSITATDFTRFYEGKDDEPGEAPPA